jgi:type II secretory pathway predicted ATPase ExeA
LYANYQGLRTDPFPNRPSPEIFFDSSVHRGAWSFLRQALRASEPFVLLTGDFGAGKTLLALKLVQALEQRQLGPCVYMSTPAQGYIEVLRRSYRALGLGEPGDDLDADRLLERVHAYFENERPARRLYIILEDPQDLDPETLHKIRLLPNYNVDGRFPVCLIMFAHTSFPRMLRDPRWQALDQRLKLRYHIPGLERSETREYIYFRLLTAQGDQQDPFAPYFEDEAIDLIHELTNGIPREINNLCGMCLTLGGSRRIVALKPGLVREAAEMLGWVLPSDNAEAAKKAQTAAAEKAKRSKPDGGRTGAPGGGTAATGSPAAKPAQPQAPDRTAPHPAAQPAPGAGQQPPPGGWPAQGAAYPPGSSPAWGGVRSDAPHPYAAGAHPGYGGASMGPAPHDAGFGGGASQPNGPAQGLGQQGGPPDPQGGLKQYAWWFAVGGLVVLILAVAMARNVDLSSVLG